MSQNVAPGSLGCGASEAGGRPGRYPTQSRHDCCRPDIGQCQLSGATGPRPPWASQVGGVPPLTSPHGHSCCLQPARKAPLGCPQRLLPRPHWAHHCRVVQAGPLPPLPPTLNIWGGQEPQGKVLPPGKDCLVETQDGPRLCGWVREKAQGCRVHPGLPKGRVGPHVCSSRSRKEMGRAQAGCGWWLPAQVEVGAPSAV